MKYILQEDDDFKLEVVKDDFGNVRLINTFKQGEYTDIDEMLLTEKQQSALKDFLNSL